MEIVYGFGWYLIFILSAVFHEAAHAWAAMRGGDPTAYLGGQVSLDPVPHIKRSPIGMVVMPIISVIIMGWPFGFASTPYDPVWAHKHPRKEAWMALAGPATNLLLVIVAAIGIKAGIVAGVFEQPLSINFRSIVDPAVGGGWMALSIFLSMLFTLNLIMVVLNLLPLPPFDGAGALSLFLPEDMARKYRVFTTNPMFAFFGFIVAWQIFSPLFQAVFPMVINILYWGSHYG